MNGRIDAHQHCWQLSRPECHWPGPELAPIYRDFSPIDWHREAEALGFEGSVLVQSQPDERDSDYLLALADAYPWIRGVVAWVDLKSPRAPERIAALARSPRLCGLRPMLQAMAEERWVANPALDPAVAAMVEHRLCFDGLVDTRHLPALLWLAQRHPQLSIVVDHAAKPPIAQGVCRQWQAQMAELAACPNVSCKLSGLLTEAPPGCTLENLRPWVRTLLDQFGPSRLLWGSDWPVIHCASDYRHWVELSEQLLAPLTPVERQAIWGENARRIYRLSD